MTVADRHWLAWGLLAFSLALVVAAGAIALPSGGGEISALVFLGALALAFGVVGALVAARRSRNPIGWIFLGASVAASSTYLAEAWAAHYIETGVGGQVLAGVAATYDQVSWVPFVVAPTTFVLLLVPGGHLLTPRWRWVGRSAAAGMFGIFITGGIVDGPIPDYPELDNPLGVASSSALVPFQAVALVLAAVGIVGSAISLILRFRSARGEERLQLKWLALAGAVAGLTILFGTTAGYVLLGDDSTNFLIMLSIIGLPVATGIAITRYRLYDVDLVINRALVYGSLTATLAGTYVGTVLLLQLMLGGITEGSGPAVAASTLMVAALFRPVRARVQQVVDRRFFRGRYDAARTLELFGARVRREVDLDRLSGDLQTVAAETMQPAHVSLWLRRGSH